MIRRKFIKGALATGIVAGLHQAAEAGGSGGAPARDTNSKYRGGVIGLGFMGALHDMGRRSDAVLDPHRRTYHHEHPGNEGLPGSYSEAMWDRPEIELVAGAEVDPKRLELFGQRYGIKALYTDGVEMMHKEKLDIVAICTNTKPRPFLTVKAAELGVKGILAEKPMCHTLEEADQMVKACADRGIPLAAGAITTTHPSFAKAKELVTEGAIGEVVSMEAPGPNSQHESWSYFLDSPVAWVVGWGDLPRREGGSDEFAGTGIAVTQKGMLIHFRRGAPQVRISGSKGEILFTGGGIRVREHWKLLQPPQPGLDLLEMPWPAPQFLRPYGAVYTLDDLMNCLAGKLDEPKVSGRRMAVALEVEIAMKESSRLGGKKVDLPLRDRSLGLNYASFR